MKTKPKKRGYQYKGKLPKKIKSSTHRSTMKTLRKLTERKTKPTFKPVKKFKLSDLEEVMRLSDNGNEKVTPFRLVLTVNERDSNYAVDGSILNMIVSLGDLMIQQPILGMLFASGVDFAGTLKGFGVKHFIELPEGPQRELSKRMMQVIKMLTEDQAKSSGINPDNVPIE